MNSEVLRKRFLKSNYRSKGTDFSASSLASPKYYLWLYYHTKGEVKEDPYDTNFDAILGQAWHAYCQSIEEIGVIKEFSLIKSIGQYTVGGTADELRFNDGIWQLADHKTKKAYGAKNFLGGDNSREIIQLSIYRWLFSEAFNIQDVALIYLWMTGITKRDTWANPNPYRVVQLQLMSIDDTRQFMREQIKAAVSDNPPEEICPKWMCRYCSLKEVCTVKQ